MRGAKREYGFSLVELVVVCFVLGVVLVIVMSFLVSAQRTMQAGTAVAADEAAAKSALTLLEADLRFASNVSISTDGSTLYVASSSPGCAAWRASGGNLVEQTTSSGPGSVVAEGVSNLTFAGNPSYAGLVSIGFTLLLPQYSRTDTKGATVLETLKARNMTTPVGSSSQACTLP